MNRARFEDQSVAIKMLKNIISAFMRFQVVPTHTEKAKRASDRSIVALHSNGNIRLQHGKYVTKADLDRQYDRVAAYDFSA
jgi:hypothetical protein